MGCLLFFRFCRILTGSRNNRASNVLGSFRSNRAKTAREFHKSYYAIFNLRLNIGALCSSDPELLARHKLFPNHILSRFPRQFFAH